VKSRIYWLLTANRAFELRQQGDYRENVELTREQVTPLIEAATTFLEMVKAYMSEKQARSINEPI